MLRLVPRPTPETQEPDDGLTFGEVALLQPWQDVYPVIEWLTWRQVDRLRFMRWRIERGEMADDRDN